MIQNISTLWLTILSIEIMSKEKDSQDKTGKKAPASSLKEKRSAKATKRQEKNNDGKV